MSETGPIYGVALLSVLPLDGGMKQAMPSRADLDRVREVSERTVAGFEVLTEHYRRALAKLERARKYVTGYGVGSERNLEWFDSH